MTPGARFALLLLDAVATAAIFYCASAATFLAGDGVIGPRACLATQAAGLILFASLSAVPLSGSSGRRPRVRAILSAMVAYLLLAVWLPSTFASFEPGKGSSALWLAQEWWKLPSNLWFFLRVSPVASAFLAAWALLAFHRLVAKGKPLVLAAGGAALLFFLVGRTAAMGSGLRVIAYGLVFLVPLGGLVFLAFTRRERALARLGILGFGGALLMLFYSATLPIAWRSPFQGERGVRRVWPPAGTRPDIPLEYLRAFTLDATSRTVFSAYGPTSGVFRLRIETGEVDVIETLGVVRSLWVDPDANLVLAPDWLDTDLLVLRKDPFAVIDRVDLYDDLVVAPYSFEATADRLYLVSTDLPGLTEYARPEIRKLRQLSFRDLGLTRFRSGAWDCALDAAARRFFVEIGAIDLSGEYLLVRIDLDEMRVDGTGRLPEGGLEILLLPTHGSLLAMSFFSDRIYELDARSLEIRRILRGPLTTRASAYDARRDLLYLLGFARGDLWVVRYSDGVVLERVFAGRKAISLAFDEAADRLVVGGADGIYEIDLAAFLGAERS